MSSCSEMFGLAPDVPRQAMTLALLCAVIPVLQLIILSVVKFFHPSIVNDGQNTLQSLAHTKNEFQNMAKSVLTGRNKKHHESIRKWLSITTLNANNYSQDERNSNAPVLDKNVDGRSAIIMTFDSQALIPSEDVIKQGGGRMPTSSVSETPMMRMINYHVYVMGWTDRLEQLNVGLKLSHMTELRKKRLPWRGVVDVLRTIEDKARLPSALNYSVVRALKDRKDWNYAEMGTRLDPQTLSEKPWPQIRDQANSYMNSFLVDVFLHWFKIWFSLVLIKVLLS